MTRLDIKSYGTDGAIRSVPTHVFVNEVTDPALQVAKAIGRRSSYGLVVAPRLISITPRSYPREPIEVYEAGYGIVYDGRPFVWATARFQVEVYKPRP